MGYYIVAFALSFFMMDKYRKTSQQKYIIFSILPIILLSGFRYDVGTDYMFRYFPDFKSIENGIIPYNLELGYLTIVKLCLFISNNFQILMIVTAIFIYGIIYYLIYKKSLSPELSVLVFFLGGFYFDSLNIVRQYMAIALLLLCFYSVAEDKLKYSIIYLALAMTLHNTAFIFVLIYIPYILKYNIKYIKTILCLGLIATPICKPIMRVLLSGTRFIVYFEGTLSYYTQGDLQTILCIINIAVLIIYMYVVYGNRAIQEQKITILYVYAQSIAVIMNIFTGFMFIAFRFTYMFSILQVFALPYLLSYVEDDRLRKQIMSVLILIYGLSMLYLAVHVGTNEVIPYKAKFYVN